MKAVLGSLYFLKPRIFKRVGLILLNVWILPICGVASGRVGPYSLSSRLVSRRVPLIIYIVHAVGPRLPDSKSGSVMNAEPSTKGATLERCGSQELRNGVTKEKDEFFRFYSSYKIPLV